MLIVGPSLIILALGVIFVVIFEAVFPDAFKSHDRKLVKKTVIYKKSKLSTDLEEKERKQRGPVKRGEKELKPSDYMVRDNTQNLP